MEEEKTVNLQEAFKAFLEKKREEIKARNMKAKVKRTPEEKEKLRAKFVEKALSYLGRPYQTKGHTEEELPKEPPFSLDCCGLVRQILRDMNEELGFKVKGYNQAYMFDTLPVEIPSYKEAKPGDLIFYAGHYFDTKSKQQIHHMVHVEIVYPDPENPDKERCIGSRFRNGYVSVFDSYKFPSTRWELEKIYFKSIDTWLDGICQSFCPNHCWDSGWSSAVGISSRSIFSPAADEMKEDECLDAEPEELGSEEEKEKGKNGEGEVAVSPVQENKEME